MKALVAYFSVSGVTEKVARKLAEVIDADLFEIVPEEPYTSADVNWMNPLARCNREKLGKKDVPIADTVHHMDEYDIVFLGFPIWYNCAPNVVNTFLKCHDMTWKKIAVFATAGGSSIGKTAEKLKPYAVGAEILDAKLFKEARGSLLKEWAQQFL